MKTKFRRASQLSPEKRKKQLTESAVKAFAANGIGRANHAQVAKIAGVAVSTVFTYFPTRETLVEGVLITIEDELLSIVREEFSSTNTTAFEKLEGLLLNYLKAIDEQPDLVKVFLDWTTSYESFLAQRYQEYLQKLVKLLSGIVIEGQQQNEFGALVDPVMASMMVHSSANTLAQLKFFNKGIDATDYIMTLISSVLHLSDEETARYQEKRHRRQASLVRYAPHANKQTSSSLQLKNKTILSPRERTKRFWMDHIQQWHNGGLSQADYCKQNDLKVPTFSYWRKKAER